ncbi:MAG: HAD family hydrolase [Candidatus Aenigmatarchaeota archaeon]
MTQAVIFDCWGTLFKNKRGNPYKRLLKRFGHNLGDYEATKKVERNFMLEKHEDFDEPLKRLFEELGVEYSEETFKEAKELLATGMDARPFPDTLQVLEKLRENYRLGLITNTDYFGFHMLKEKYSLEDLFNQIVTSYRVGALKPDKEIFERMLEELNVGKSEVIMVGDSLEKDTKAAENYGIEGVLIDRDREHPDYPNRIESLRELEDRLNDV